MRLTPPGSSARRSSATRCSDDSGAPHQSHCAGASASTPPPASSSNHHARPSSIRTSSRLHERHTDAARHTPTSSDRSDPRQSRKYPIPDVFLQVATHTRRHPEALRRPRSGASVCNNHATVPYTPERGCTRPRIFWALARVLRTRWRLGTLEGSWASGNGAKRAGTTLRRTTAGPWRIREGEPLRSPMRRDATAAHLVALTDSDAVRADRQRARAGRVSEDNDRDEDGPD